MGKEFIILKMDSTDVAVDIFKGISSSLTYEYSFGLLIMDIDISMDNLKSIVSSLESELYTNIVAFKSGGLFSDRRKEYLDILIPLIKEKNSGIYGFKDLLLSSNLANKSTVLDFILSRTGVAEEFICEFAKNDLNASKASKALYMHRNTVLYKVEKLLEMTGFDVRCFLDLYILYSLIDKKDIKN